MELSATVAPPLPLLPLPLPAGTTAGRGRRRARVVLHVDLDCFYAQVEEGRDPSLRGRPMGVFQKFLLVTCNYAARARGVPKMVPVAEAKKACAELVLINGEDLAPYRAASTAILQVVRSFAERVERLGLDELYVDATEIVDVRLSHGAFAPDRWDGYVAPAPAPASPADSLLPRQPHGAPPQSSAAAQAGGDGEDGEEPEEEEESALERRLMVGSQLLSEIRQAIFDRVGYTCSGGVATSKFLAKLASGLRKPNQQSVVLPSAVALLLPPLRVGKLTGVGHRLGGQLRDNLHVETVGELQRFPLAYLVDVFGPRTGEFLFNIARGIDPTEVTSTGAPKTVSEEDSFMVCRTLEDAQRRLEGIVQGLLVRLDQDAEAFGRHATQVRLGARIVDTVSSTSAGHSTAAEHFARETKSVPMPLDCLDRRVDVATRTGALVAGTLLPLLRRMIGPVRFNLTLLNVCATHFVDAAPSATIRTFFAGGPSRDAASEATTPPRERLDPSVWNALPAELQAEIRASGRYDLGSLEPGKHASASPVARPRSAGKADLRAWVVRSGAPRADTKGMS